jgi:hypothetical protein
LTSLAGFGAVIMGKRLVPYDESFSYQYKDKGLFNTLSSYNISFPKDYITFVIVGGLVWPWLQKKTGWSNKVMYALGSLTFLYIISTDGKNLLPKKNYEHQFDNKYWYDNTKYGTDYNALRKDKLYNYPENTIKDKKYEDWGEKTEGYPVILGATIYSLFFYGLLGKSIYYLFNDAPKIYPFIDD